MANSTNETLVKSDSTRVPFRKVLTVHERQALERQVDIFGVGQVNGDNFGIGTNGATPTDVPWLRKNKSRLNEQQRQVMKVLEEGSPVDTNPQERDAIDRRCAALKEQMIPYLQTGAELRAYSHRDPVFMSALKKAREWNKGQKELGGRTPEEVCEEFRNLRRRLEPENPEADSLEEFRRTK